MNVVDELASPQGLDVMRELAQQRFRGRRPPIAVGNAADEAIYRL